jgi:hypothetical protein
LHDGCLLQLAPATLFGCNQARGCSSCSIIGRRRICISSMLVLRCRGSCSSCGWQFECALASRLTELGDNIVMVVLLRNDPCCVVSRLRQDLQSTQSKGAHICGSKHNDCLVAQTVSSMAALTRAGGWARLA